MARAAQQKVYADFRQGFVTVANPLAFPEGSVKDIVNFDIKDNGTLARRPGLIRESAGSVNTGLSIAELSGVAVSLNVWNNVANIGGDSLAVVQVGRVLKFYKMLDEGIDISSPEGEVTLPIPAEGENIEVTTASGNGLLFVAHPSIRTKLIRKEEESFVVEDIRIKIRDMSAWKGENDLQTGFTSDSLYPQHEYNLRNAGWPRSAQVSKEADADDGTTRADPVFYTKQKINKYPSISVPFYAAKAGGGSNLVEQNAYNPWVLINDSYYGYTLPAVGHYVVDAEFWQRRGEGADSIGGGANPSKVLQKNYSWTSYPTSVEFYAGRVWYAGAKGYSEVQVEGGSYSKKDNLNTSSTLYFSQQMDIDMDKAGLCYQANDPTAEDVNQLLPTDGGTFSIKGAGEIFAIKAYRTALLVFSDQGVWSVSGVDGNSFDADNVSVVKISNIGPVSKNAISLSSDSVFFLADDAIYVIVQDEVSGLPTTRDITSSKIKDFYSELSNSQKAQAKVAFDRTNRIFYMIYKDSSDRIYDSPFIPYTNVLVFNQDLGAYYKYKIGSYDNFIVAPIYYQRDNVTSYKENVTLDGEVVTLDGEPVTLDTKFGNSTANGVQFLTISYGDTEADMFFSSFSNTDTYEDWDSSSPPYVEFGFDAAGDIMRDSKTAPFIIAHLERTETAFTNNTEDASNNTVSLNNKSRCDLSYAWDWSSNYSSSVNIYRLARRYTPAGQSDEFDYGPEVVTTKTRIRGKGYSLGIRLSGGISEDCRILGIGILYTAPDRI